MSLIIERSGEGFTSFNGNKLSNCCGEQNYNDAFRGVYFSRIGKKNLKLNVHCYTICDRGTLDVPIGNLI